MHRLHCSQGRTCSVLLRIYSSANPGFLPPCAQRAKNICFQRAEDVTPAVLRSLTRHTGHARLGKAASPALYGVTGQAQRRGAWIDSFNLPHDLFLFPQETRARQTFNQPHHPRGNQCVMPMEAIVNFPHQVYLAEFALQHARRGVVTYYYMASAVKRSMSPKVVTS